MRLKSRTLSLLISFLLGAFWAFALLGALSALLRNLHEGILYAVASMIVWVLPGLFGVVLMEYLLAGFERNDEIRRQTRLLEKIARHMESRSKE